MRVRRAHTRSLVSFQKLHSSEVSIRQLRNCSMILRKRSPLQIDLVLRIRHTYEC